MTQPANIASANIASANITPANITPKDLASIGEGHLAYLRRMSSDDIRARFPSAQSIRPGLNLWALFGADGTPLAVSDDRGSILASATENELLTVSIH